jgi:hypothetical protein
VREAQEEEVVAGRRLRVHPRMLHRRGGPGAEPTTSKFTIITTPSVVVY